MLKICKDRAVNSDDSSGPVLKNHLNVHKGVGSLFESGEDLRTHCEQDASYLCTKSTDFNNNNGNRRGYAQTNTDPLAYIGSKTSLARRPFMTESYNTRASASHHPQVSSSSLDSDQNGLPTLHRQLSAASFADKLMDPTNPEVRLRDNNSYSERRLLQGISPTESSANTNQYELSSVSSTSARAESNQISSENNYHNPDSLTGLKNKRQQHRRLQQQVHQQLQRIYGDKLHAIEQQQQQQQQVSSAMHDIRPVSHKPAKHPAKLGPTDVLHVAKTGPFDPSFKHDPNCPRLNRERLQAAHNDALLKGHKLPLICPIEEECYHAKRHASDEPSSNEYNDCIVLDEDRCDGKDDNRAGSDGPDYDARDANNNNLHVRSNMPADNHRDPVEDDRKRQLESLHYATATAAALLSATANAAAAFAANENKLYSGDTPAAANKTNMTRQNFVNPAANTYQDVAQSNGHRQANHQRPQQVQQHPQQQRQASRLQQPQQRPYQSFPYEQPLQRKLPAPNASNANGLHQANNLGAQNAHPVKLDYGPASQRAQQAVLISSGVYRSQQQQQNVAYSFDKLPSRPVNQSQLPPPLPKPMMHARLYQQQQQQQQAQIIHQQQQHQFQRQLLSQQLLAEQPQSQLQQRFSLAPNAMPTLAILHHNKKGKSLKVDLIGRLPLTQIAPVKTYPTASAAQMPCYPQNEQQSIYTADLSSILAGRLPSRHMANRSMVNMAAGNIPALTYTVPPSQDKIYACNQQQTGASVVALQAGPIQSSDSIASGRSDMPLVLDRRLRKASILERICRIDLTAFWWALLIVCMISICLAITIFKQFH